MFRGPGIRCSLGSAETGRRESMPRLVVSRRGERRIQYHQRGTVHFVAAETVLTDISALFDVMKMHLSGLLPRADVQHVGSTAVPGTVTKGDLDINVRVTESDFADTVVILKSHYEVNQPRNWSDCFASFKDDARDLGIQVTVLGSPADDFVVLRDLLLCRPDLVARCNELKLRHQGGSMDVYRRQRPICMSVSDGRITHGLICD
jgi:GrpB-like predicted nucleotidyltransferase (UPF0157 family)